MLALSGLVFEYPIRLWLILLIGLPVVILGVRWLKLLEPARRWIVMGLRVGVLMLITLMLAGAQSVQTHDNLTVIAVVDISDSVQRFATLPDGLTGQDPQAWIADFLQRAGTDIRPDDRFVYVAFDGRARVASRQQGRVRLESGALVDRHDGTNIAAAIRQAIAAHRDTDSAMRLVLATDGNDTDGDTVAALLEAAAAGVEVDLIPIRYRLADEVMVERLSVPTEAREGQTIRVTATLRATRPTAGIFEVTHDGSPVGRGVAVRPEDWASESGLSSTAGIDPSASGRYVAQVRVDVPLTAAGRSAFRGQFVPDGGRDTLASNNTAEAYTVVQGQSRVLVVNGEGGDGSVLPERLAARGLVVETVEPMGFDASLNSLQRYDAVVLQNIAAESVPGNQQAALASYVRDLGGGLLMLGGPQSFGAGAWTNSVIDEIMPVTCELPSQTILPSGALMIVIDHSGSMGAPVAGLATQQEVANEAAILAIHTLYPGDLVGVIAFDDGPDEIVPLQRNSDPASVTQRVSSIQPGGGTSIFPALRQAYRELAKTPVSDAAIRHIILLTDGMDGTGINQYDELLSDMAQDGVTLSTIGVGDGHESQLLEALAIRGGGAYHNVDDPTNLPQVFIKEAQTIRKNLIREIPFLPFIEPSTSPITAGIASFPELTGLVLTGAREDPRVQMPLTGPEGEPLLAHWQVGLGRTGAFTSDATTRWAADWVGWDGYADFWASMVRLVARPSASRDVDVRTAIVGNRLQIRMDTAGLGQAMLNTDGGDDRNGEPISEIGGAAAGATVRGAVVGPDGEATPIELRQTGPGLFEGDAPAGDAGGYLVYLDMASPDGTRRSIFAGAQRPAGRELRRLASNDALFRRFEEISSGRILELDAGVPVDLFERTRPFETRSMRPLWRLILPWLLALVLLDIAARRIAWDPNAIVRAIRSPRSARHENAAERTVTGLKNVRAGASGTTGESTANPQATPALSLKERRDRARNRFQANAADAGPRGASSRSKTSAQPSSQGGSQTGTTSRRKSKATPTGDLSDAIDGQAAAGGPRQPAEPKTPPPTSEVEPGDARSRLFAAKRRARDRIDE